MLTVKKQIQELVRYIFQICTVSGRKRWNLDFLNEVPVFYIGTDRFFDRSLSHKPWFIKLNRALCVLDLNCFYVAVNFDIGKNRWEQDTNWECLLQLLKRTKKKKKIWCFLLLNNTFSPPCLLCSEPSESISFMKSVVLKYIQDKYPQTWWNYQSLYQLVIIYF